MLRLFVVSFSFFCLSISLQAQHDLRSGVPDAILFRGIYTFQIPMADMAKRFGVNSQVGGAIDYKYRLWMFGVEGGYLFGNKVKESNIIDNLRNENGYLVNTDGEEVVIPIYERGWSVKANFSRILAFKRPNINSGLLFQLGIGYLQHKILIDADPEKIPQLNKTYIKGYDRLCGGLYLTQFIGYQFLDNRKFLNFYLGCELGEAFTKSLRNWQFDTNTAAHEKRNDLFFGVKAGLIIPIYVKERQSKFYYD